MTVRSDRTDHIRSLLAGAWPGTTLDGDPVPLTGGFWASMDRLRLRGQPVGVPGDVVFRLAPDVEMGRKEASVQRAVAAQGYPTPPVHLTGTEGPPRHGVWSVMDFAPGRSPLGDLDALAVLRRAPKLFARLPDQLAVAAAGLHALDPAPVGDAVADAAPTASWRVGDLLEHFRSGAVALDLGDVAVAVQELAGRRPPESDTVICHGDLHPFNLLVDDQGRVTTVDWTAAIRAEPAFDLAFTTLLLSNPPLAAPRPLTAVIGAAGSLLARRFLSRYRHRRPETDLRALDWYRALHCARILVEARAQGSRDGGPANHPFTALVPVAASTLAEATGVPVSARVRVLGDQ